MTAVSRSGSEKDMRQDLDEWKLFSNAVFNERMCLVRIVAVEKLYNIAKPTITN